MRRATANCSRASLQSSTSAVRVARWASSRASTEELITTGSKGVGTVLSVQDTGTTINNNPRIKMRFRIEPLDGSAAFEAEKTRTVSRLEIPRQGDCYPVWYDAQDPETWMFAIIADETGRTTARDAFGTAAARFTGMGEAAPASAAPQLDPVAALTQLAELHKQGVLTDDEFAAQKAKLLG